MKILLISDTRSGSTALVRGLAKSLKIQRLGEIIYPYANVDPNVFWNWLKRSHFLFRFLPRKVRLVIFSNLPSGKKKKIYKSYFTFLNQSNPKGWVAKVMFHDLVNCTAIPRDLSPSSELLESIKHEMKDVLLILLTRTDYVSAAISELRACDSGIYHHHSSADSINGQTMPANKIDNIATADKAFLRARNLIEVKLLLNQLDLRAIEIDYSVLESGKITEFLRPYCGNQFVFKAATKKLPYDNSISADVIEEITSEVRNRLCNTLKDFLL